MWHARYLYDQFKTKRRVPVTAICFAAVLLCVVSIKGAGSLGSTQWQHINAALDIPQPVCPGPVLEPSERQEPRNKKFARKLNEEVAVRDAGKVEYPVLGPSHH